MARDRFGASPTVRVESAGAGAGSARSGGCNGIWLGEADAEAVRRALERPRLVRVSLVDDVWATWGQAGPD